MSGYGYPPERNDRVTTDPHATDIGSPMRLDAPMPADTDWTRYADHSGAVHVYLPAAALAPAVDDVTALREAITGDAATPLPQLRYWPVPDGAWQAQFDAVAPDFGDEPTITLSMDVEHTYELYGDVTAYVVDAVVPAPPTDEDSPEYDEWHQTYIIDQFTGVGRTHGDSWYNLTVTDCSDPALIGRTFNWGY